jgi:pimeloyl-ACP methyl ester carboxylesterase
MVLQVIVIVVLLALAGIGIYLLVQKKKTRTLAAQAEAAVPPLGRFLDITTGRLHYIDKGEGQPIVMVHGLGAQMRSLTMALLEPLSKDFRVIAIDRPGMGYSDRPESASARIDDQAGYVEEVIDALGLERPIVLGHSLGGAIAAALALRAPDKVAGLALVAPLLQRSTRSVDSFAPLGVTDPGRRRFIAHTLAVPASARNSEQTLAEVFGPEAVPDGYAVAGGGLMSLRPNAYLNASRDYCAVNEVIREQSDRYDEITCPVHVLYGTEDRILDHREQGTAIAERYPHVHLETVEGAGHMLPLTRPDRVIELVHGVARAL